MVEPFRDVGSLLYQMRRTFNERLQRGLVAAPAFRRYYRRNSDGDGDGDRINIAVSAEGVGNTELMLYVKLLRCEDLLHQRGFARTLESIQRLLDQDASRSALISPWLAETFGEFTLLGESVRQLDWFEPWALMIAADPASDVSVANAALITEPLDPFITWSDKSLSAEMGEADFLGGREFEYPADRKRTEGVIKKMREAEANLDKFWSRWDTSLETGGIVTEQVLVTFLDTRLFQRTPTWIPLEERGISKTARSDDVDQRLNLLELESRTEKTISTEDTREPKNKLKTRGVAEPSKVAVQTPGADFPAAAMIPKFFLD